MSNPKQTNTAKANDSFLYSDTSEERLQLVSNPFHPVFFNEETIEGQNPTPPQVKFVQAYIISYYERPLDYYFIEDMDKAFDLDIGVTEPFERVYEVKIELEESNGRIKNAKFQKKPVEGELGYREPSEEFNTYNEQTSFPSKKPIIIYFPVCKLINDNLEVIWMRDNIHWWGPQDCQMWAPTITDTSKEGDPPVYEFTFGRGVVNNFLIEEYLPLVLTAQQSEGVMWMLIHVDINLDGSVDFVWGELLTEANLQGKELDPVGVDEIPVHIDIILGSISNGRSCLYYKDGIQITPYQWFQKTKENEQYQYGQAPFTTYWKLKVSSSLNQD